MTIEILSKTPATCTTAEIAEFCRLVQQGGQVHGGDLERRVQRAKRLVFLLDGSTLAGTAAIKMPTDQYRQRIFAAAQVPMLEREFDMELGYVVVADQYRGQRLSRIAVETALESFPITPLWATSRADRDRMHHTLQRFSFVRVGDPYLSRDGEGEVVLFVRAAQQQ